MNLFNWFKKEKKNDLTAHDVFMYATGTKDSVEELKNRLHLLEDELGVCYFAGPKNKAHYRKKKKSKQV